MFLNLIFSAFQVSTNFLNYSVVERTHFGVHQQRLVFLKYADYILIITN